MDPTKNGSAFDVIIVGGGAAGCATTLSLLGHGEGGSILLLDDADPVNFKVGESLPPESSRILQHLHPALSENLARDSASGVHLLCTGNVSSWASCALEERHAIMNPFGHGFHLNRAAFDESLRRTVRDCQSRVRSVQKSIDMMKGKFKAVEKDSSGSWIIHADIENEAKTFLAKWVVDATGRKASLATKLGAKIITSDPLLAFYAVFTGPPLPNDPDVDNDHRTMIEAIPGGWLYSALLSLDPCTRIVVFHTLPTHPAAKRARRHDGFLDILHTSSSHISSIIQKHGYEISSGFPCCTAAGSSHLDKACSVDDRWIAVGDSAMAFDPLSSQGMMTALEMGYYVGAVLAGQIANESEEDACLEIAEMYSRVMEEYRQHRAYYYGIVKRFHGEEFWNQTWSSSP